MFHIPFAHKFLEKALQSCCRALFPWKSDGWEPPPDEHEILLAAEKFDRWPGLGATFPALVACALVFLLIYSFPYFKYGRPQDAVYENHQVIQTLIISGAWGAAVSLYYQPWIAARYWGDHLSDYYACTSRARGYDRLKAQRFGRPFAVLCFTLFTVLFWNEGTVIDARGIRFHNFLSAPRSESYSHVRSIGLCEKSGPRDNSSLRIWFDDGDPFDLPESDFSEPEGFTAAIAGYISERSGEPVKRACRADSEEYLMPGPAGKRPN